MTRYCRRVIVFCRAEPSGAPTAIVRGVLTNTRHSRERPCEEIGRPYKYSSFPRKRESVCGVSVRITAPISRAPPPDSRLRGNDEVLLAGYCLLSRRTLRRSVRHSERHTYKYSSFPRKRESVCGVSVRITASILRAPPPDSRFRGNDEYCQRVIVFCRAEPSGAPSAIVRGAHTHTRHSRERPCEEIGRPYKYSSFPRKRESITAFPQE